MVSIKEVGEFCKTTSGGVPQVKHVVGRLMEEAVELALASGLTAGEISGHIADALHNQSLKTSSKIGRTIFPSELVAPLRAEEEIAEECADVQLILKHVAYVAKVNLQEEEKKKWAKFITLDFKVSRKGLLYAKKPHIK